MDRGRPRGHGPEHRPRAGAQYLAPRGPRRRRASARRRWRRTYSATKTPVPTKMPRSRRARARERSRAAADANATSQPARGTALPQREPERRPRRELKEACHVVGVHEREPRLEERRVREERVREYRDDHSRSGEGDRAKSVRRHSRWRRPVLLPRRRRVPREGSSRFLRAVAPGSRDSGRQAGHVPMGRGVARTGRRRSGKYSYDHRGSGTTWSTVQAATTASPGTSAGDGGGAHDHVERPRLRLTCAARPRRAPRTGHCVDAHAAAPERIPR